MSIFDGFEDINYFDKITVLITIILFIFFYYLTNSIYQSAVLATSVLFIHYKYIENKNKQLLNNSENNFNTDNYLDDIKLENYQKEIIQNVFPKSKYIHDYHNYTILNFLFLNQEFYYYNPQNWINMIKFIDKFLEIYNDITIDISKAGILYNSMKDLRDNAINELIGIKINAPDNKKVLIKINDSINELEKILNKYLYDVYIKNEIHIKNEGFNNHTVLINPQLFDN